MLRPSICSKKIQEHTSTPGVCAYARVLHLEATESADYSSKGRQCHSFLLINLSNSLDSNQDQQNVNPDLHSNCLTHY